MLHIAYENKLYQLCPQKVHSVHVNPVGLWWFGAFMAMIVLLLAAFGYNGCSCEIVD